MRWRPVLDERHVAIGTEQFSLVCCFIHIFTVKDRFHLFLEYVFDVIIGSQSLSLG